MTTTDHLSWENFRTTVFIPGQQRLHRVVGSPSIELFGDGIANRIGILLAIPAGTSIPLPLGRLAFIHARIFSAKGSTFLEVATCTTSLHHQFYHFAVAVAERVVVEKLPAVEAISLELECFSDLLEEKSLLSTERQIGLLGELLFLERLIARAGVNALDAWLGPLYEPHDFRIQSHEFEVKTTVSPHRVHTIHGSEQLVPSNGCTLYLASIMLGPAGAGDGFSLSSKVQDLSSRFEALPARISQFLTTLQVAGWQASESELYTRRYALRRPVSLVPVNEFFPAITRPNIQQLLGSLAVRIESVQYDVNVEGLEQEDGSLAFEAAIAGVTQL